MAGPSNPIISVITPSLNQGRFISQAIDSVAAQEGVGVEHIVVDGGSSDDTLAILHRSEGVRWISEPDRGQSDAINKGFRMARGQVVAWLNADDYYLPGALRAVAEAFRDCTEADVIYGDYRWIDDAGRVLQQRREIDFDPFVLTYLHVLYIPSTATFFRRRIIDDGELLDEGYHLAMDYEYLLRLHRRGYRFHHIPHVLADFRWHDASKSTIAARRQRREQRRALVELTPAWSRVQEPVRGLALNGMTALARTKRFALKARGGLFRGQWQARSKATRGAGAADELSHRGGEKSVGGGP